VNAGAATTGAVNAGAATAGAGAANSGAATGAGAANGGATAAICAAGAAVCWTITVCLEASFASASCFIKSSICSVCALTCTCASSVFFIVSSATKNFLMYTGFVTPTNPSICSSNVAKTVPSNW
jgi:hypothetical protein